MKFELRQKQNITHLIADGVNVGLFGKTARTNPDYAWKWATETTFGYCATKVEAFEELKARSSAVVAAARAQAEHNAEQAAFFDSLPLSLRLLWNGRADARMRLACAERRAFFDAAAVELAETELRDAVAAYDAAERTWLLSQRSAA